MKHRLLWFVQVSILSLTGFAADSKTDLSQLKAAAVKGDAIAQFKLGAAYSKGDGVPRSDMEAVNWFLKSAKQGYPQAQHNVAVAHDNGYGVVRNTAKAALWYRKAANQGFAESQFSLGVMYYDGEGVGKDMVEAHKWMNLAASQDHKQARAALEKAEETMTPEQIVEARKRAAAFKPKKEVAAKKK